MQVMWDEEEAVNVQIKDNVIFLSLYNINFNLKPNYPA